MNFKTISIFAISLFMFIMISYVSNSPSLRAQFSILLSGHIGCRLVNPQEVITPKCHQGGLDTYKLVYKNNIYIGYVDRYGFFISRNSKEGMMDSLYQWIFIDIVKYILVVTAIVSVIPLSWRMWNLLLTPKSNHESCFPSNLKDGSGMQDDENKEK